jgi:hypothetical protein
MTKLLFQKRDSDLAVEVREIDGRRGIELLRQYEKDGEWRVTGRLDYANQHRGALLLQAAQKWIQEQDKLEGKNRETERLASEPKDWTRGLKYGRRRLLKTAEREH